eukprot:Plantae.Rhodophyta-Purpureofilum_apyrenoidigerum.ctg26039.p1 GENE.Plantae.Rhodophyta-Purpureofilum_apyrenoidigerum.ctg26039~~Plantae.Rhodophyta-Purpureofilum_apyrenoidigerum.ctg26039.p1  ORF type:complete len:211 (+),score=24.14 Plantae.Rhodophyta-Purpureofilum_apyrenoidigerum.ctg26039:216-848(+)
MAFISGVPRLLVSSFVRTVQCTQRPSRVASGRLQMALDVDAVKDAVVTVAANPAWLQKVAAAFDSMGIPAPIIKWGHPAAMGTMIAFMGIPGAAIGWLGRLSEDKKRGVNLKRLHESVMVAFLLLAFAGATGGTLSTAEQKIDIWQSTHFKSALVVLGLLTANAVLAYSGFGSNPQSRTKGRTVHSYLGAATMVGLVIHGAIGFAHGNSI